MKNSKSMIMGLWLAMTIMIFNVGIANVSAEEGDPPQNPRSVTLPSSIPPDVATVIQVLGAILR